MEEPSENISLEAMALRFQTGITGSKSDELDFISSHIITIYEIWQNNLAKQYLHINRLAGIEEDTEVGLLSRQRGLEVVSWFEKIKRYAQQEGITSKPLEGGTHSIGTSRYLELDVDLLEMSFLNRDYLLSSLLGVFSAFVEPTKTYVMDIETRIINETEKPLTEEEQRTKIAYRALKYLSTEIVNNTLEEPENLINLYKKAHQNQSSLTANRTRAIALTHIDHMEQVAELFEGLADIPVLRLLMKEEADQYKLRLGYISTG
jgi:hypothetical protein